MVVTDLLGAVVAGIQSTTGTGGRKIEVDRHLVGGCTLEKHVEEQLWPEGKVWETKDWEAFCGLAKVGIAGTKEAEPTVKIMTHLARGGQNKQSRSFLDKVLAQGVEFDILGQSYYPNWHRTLDDLKANLTDLAGRYQQDIMLVEYSVPNIREINDIVHGLPSDKGLGTFVWEPTKWEGPALFDGKGNTKPEIDVYPKMAEDYGLKDE